MVPPLTRCNVNNWDWLCNVANGLYLLCPERATQTTFLTAAPDSPWRSVSLQNTMIFLLYQVKLYFSYSSGSDYSTFYFCCGPLPHKLSSCYQWICWHGIKCCSLLLKEENWLLWASYDWSFASTERKKVTYFQTVALCEKL